MDTDIITTNADTVKEIEKQIAAVRASKDGCGEVTIQIVKSRIIRVKTQLSYNVEETQP